jgi:hypothetical protein
VIRKIPWGTFSVPLFVLGVLFSVKIGRTFCLGDIVFNAVGINAFSRFHNTLFVSLLLFAGGFTLGKIFDKHESAVLGKNLNLILGVAIIIILVGGYAFRIDFLYPLYKYPD